MVNYLTRKRKANNKFFKYHPNYRETHRILHPQDGYSQTELDYYKSIDFNVWFEPITYRDLTKDE